MQHFQQCPLSGDINNISRIILIRSFNGQNNNYIKLNTSHCYIFCQRRVSTNICQTLCIYNEHSGKFSVYGSIIPEFIYNQSGTSNRVYFYFY